MIPRLFFAAILCMTLSACGLKRNLELPNADKNKTQNTQNSDTTTAPAPTTSIAPTSSPVPAPTDSAVPDVMLTPPAQSLNAK